MMTKCDRRFLRWREREMGTSRRRCKGGKSEHARNESDVEQDGRKEEGQKASKYCPSVLGTVKAAAAGSA